MNLAEGDPVREQLNDIEKAATIRVTLRASCLRFSRKQLISPRPCNLNAVVAALEKSLGRLIGKTLNFVFT